MPRTTTLNNNKFENYSRFYYKGLLIYWILLGLLLISLIALPLIKVDVSVQSRGLIKTNNKVSPITSAVTAKVKHLNIAENKTVHIGDTLLVLEQAGIDSEITIARQQIQLYNLYLTDIDDLVSDQLPNRVKTALYQQELNDYKVGINKLNRIIEKQKLDFIRTQQLYNEGVVPSVTLLEDSFKLKACEDELQLLKSGTHAKWELDRKNYTISIHNLNITVENLLQRKDQYIILAPYDGSILSFNGIANGSIVNENDVIAMLSPEEELLAECYISPSDIGLIQKNMPVRIQVDAYNYNQWGLMDGVVVDIAHDVTEYKGHFVYTVKTKLNSNYLILNNGFKGYLKKGMSLTGRFIVTQRTVFQLLFDNINDWLNPRVIQPNPMQ